MTYRTAAGRQIIVAATGTGEDAALVAFALATTRPDVGPPVQGGQGGLKGRFDTDDGRIDSSRGGK
jgi:hypothetical protein